MDNTALFTALSVAREEKISLLFEAGAQPEADFLAFRAKNENRLHSLYIHPQLTALQNYGPWLLEVDDTEQLQSDMNTLSGNVAVIVSTLHRSFLAIQLSRACAIVQPGGATALVRFYAQHVITVLATCTDYGWHACLFDGITQWWLPAETQWQPLHIPQSQAEKAYDPIVRLDETTWQQIADNPLVKSVLREWRKMGSSQSFPACTQRRMVIRALDKAKSFGLDAPADRQLYALCYLNGGKKILESETVRTLLPRIVAGKESLANVLSRTSES
ncbi:DUF4123 domain-containing protein [Cronobacter turicensis]|nr:DUF4123 domain-containing protein [Cronobacter turicensis]